MILCLTILLSIFSEIRTDFSYAYHGTDWTGTCRSGQKQSPIDLVQKDATGKCLPRIRFKNFDSPLKMPLLLVNNGHTAIMELTPNGPEAYIKGGMLRDRFIAQSVHFHWGSLGTKGSEHAINGDRYDAEIHIVHQNAKYSDKSLLEASQLPNGLAALAIMIKYVIRIEDNPLNKIFEALPEVIQYPSNVTIYGHMTLQQFLGNIDTTKFYTYQGSLTTPECTESVTWTVFTEAVPIQLSLLMNFFMLRDSQGKRLVNNYRKLQDINNRRVYYRTTSKIKNIIHGWFDSYDSYDSNDSYDWYDW